MEVLNQCNFLLVKDNGLLKFIFTILASYLILETFYIFLVVKPTYTSHERRKLNADDFPEIILCPDPAINISAVNANGYRGVDKYFKGLVNNWEQVTWEGNKSQDVKTVSEEVATLKSIEECPDGNLVFEENNRLDAEFSLTNALTPFHVCCKIVLPNLSKSHHIISIRMLHSANSSFSSFIAFMADQMTASFYDQHKTIMLGDKIVSGDEGIMYYKVQIIEEENLEGDPKYPCIDYSISGKYATCVENEMVRQNSQYINCTPPWMTENEDLWCNGVYEFDSKDTGKIYYNFLGDISASEGNYGKCLVPCKVKRYQAKEIGLRESTDNNRGFIIRFENEVDITKSSWTIDAKTLLSKIGGFIGISKNFLWLLILLISSISVLFSHVQKYDK